MRRGGGEPKRFYNPPPIRRDTLVDRANTEKHSSALTWIMGLGAAAAFAIAVYDMVKNPVERAGAAISGEELPDDETVASADVQPRKEPKLIGWETK